MERRFSAALVSAVALHAALMGLSALSDDAGTRETPLASKPNEVEVSILVQDGTPSASVTEQLPGEAASSTPHEKSVARERRSPVSAAAAPVAAESESLGQVVAEPSPGEPDASGVAPGQTPRRHIDLGLDGSIVARTLHPTERRDTEEQRRARRRPALVFDGWSEGVVRKLAHSDALGEGSALLTIEWGADGRLTSIRSSAESSNADAWRKLAATLQKQLAQRPQPASKGLRLVYLVKSEVVKPSQKSKLPESRNVQAQQFRDDYLPPASAVMLGVSADTSPAGQRVVSVTLANSQVL